MSEFDQMQASVMLSELPARLALSGQSADAQRLLHDPFFLKLRQAYCGGPWSSLDRFVHQSLVPLDAKAILALPDGQHELVVLREYYSAAEGVSSEVATLPVHLSTIRPGVRRVEVNPDEVGPLEPGGDEFDPESFEVDRRELDHGWSCLDADGTLAGDDSAREGFCTMRLFRHA